MNNDFLSGFANGNFTLNAYPQNEPDNIKYTFINPSELTEEEKEQLLFEEAIRRLEQDEGYLEAKKTLSIKDLLGYENEMQTIERLKMAGLYRKTKHIGTVHRNPKNPYNWKRQKENGVDLIYKISKLTIHVEMGYSSTVYKFKAPWFFKNRLPRYRYCKNDNNHIKLYVTNKPQNLAEIKNLFLKYGITILDVKGLIDYLQRLIAQQYKNQPSSKAKAQTVGKRDFCCSLSHYLIRDCNSANSILSLDSNNKELNVYASILDNSNSLTNLEIIVQNLVAIRNGTLEFSDLLT